jgi:hypothetical protein
VLKKTEIIKSEVKKIPIKDGIAKKRRKSKEFCRSLNALSFRLLFK